MPPGGCCVPAARTCGARPRLRPLVPVPAIARVGNCQSARSPAYENANARDRPHPQSLY